MTWAVSIEHLYHRIRMAVPFSNTKLRVPRGFQNLLEGLAREVLRSQPEELYTFGAQYFEALIKQREGRYFILSRRRIGDE